MILICNAPYDHLTDSTKTGAAALVWAVLFVNSKKEKFNMDLTLAAVALLLFSDQALGADADVIQSLQDEFRNQTGTWFGPLKNIATWLLISLATIAWTWSAGQMVLRNADLQEFMVLAGEWRKCYI